MRIRGATKKIDLTYNAPDTLAAYLSNVFSSNAAIDSHVSRTTGGRSHALRVLADVQPRDYAQTRGHLDGAVTHLSAYIRHGVLTLAETRDDILKRFGPHAPAKLINELAWRDYFQRVYDVLGARVHTSLEPYATGLKDADYAPDMPPDILEARTGLACMDGFVSDLYATGYLHNHARMWTAAYLVHDRRVHWRAGAEWFRTHLLDGDEASNDLSWQWVTGTFSNKPYFFNRENLERLTAGKYCRNCSQFNHCPFSGSYEDRAQQLFPHTHPTGMDRPAHPERLRVISEPRKNESFAGRVTTAWVHIDDLNPHSPTLAHADRAVFVFDPEVIAKWSLKRIVFVYECLLEFPAIDVYVGDTNDVLNKIADAGIVTTRSVAPWWKRVAQDIPAMNVVDLPAFVAPEKPVDVTRFSRYWGKVERMANKPTPVF